MSDWTPEVDSWVLVKERGRIGYVGSESTRHPGRFFVHCDGRTYLLGADEMEAAPRSRAPRLPIAAVVVQGLYQVETARATVFGDIEAAKAWARKNGGLTIPADRARWGD